MSSYDAVVVGAGVIGLSTAIELNSKGVKVAIVARDLPQDTGSVGFASPWAGCNWCSYADEEDSLMGQVDKITFKRFEKLAKERPDLCEMIPFITVWNGEKPDGGDPWFKHITPGFKRLEASSPKPAGKTFGHSYNSFVLNAPQYLVHLADICAKHQIPIIRQRLSSLDEAYDLPDIGPVGLVINATGLGARWLPGVEDPKVYPAKGQTVLVRAPGVKTCYMSVEGGFNVAPGQEGDSIDGPKPVYIIPRPGPEGHVILGGTYFADDHSTLPSMQEAERIIRQCLELEPRLTPNGSTNWQDVEIVAHNAGLRPAREGGIRIELETRVLGEGKWKDLLPKIKGSKREVGVVHAYGLGSGGYQGSWGVAEKATELALRYLKGEGQVKAKL